MKMACFLSKCFYDQPVTCPAIYYWKELFKLIRIVFNLLKSVHIKLTYHHFNPRPYFTTCRKDKIGLKFVTFLSFQLLENVINHFIRIYATFQMAHYSLMLNLRATKGGGSKVFRCHTFCIWNKILTF